jgi:fructose-specific phosphotransferase system IIC component
LDRTIPQNLLALINALLAALMSTLLACIASYYVIIIAIMMGIFYQLLEYVDETNIPDFLGGACKCKGGCSNADIGPWYPID